MSAQTGLGLPEALHALRTLESRPGSERARARERLANAAEARLVRHEDYEAILARIANGSLAPEDAVEVIGVEDDDNGMVPLTDPKEHSVGGMWGHVLRRGVHLGMVVILGSTTNMRQISPTAWA